MSLDIPNYERGLGFVLNDVSRLLRKEFDRRVRGFGLTRAQWMLLAYAAREPGATQSDLAEILQQEKITVSRQASRLEKNGWLERHDHAADGRAYRLQLTPKAKEMVARLAKVAEELRLDALSGFPAARREALINDLLRVKANLLRMPLGGDGPNQS
ncbi:MAG TPA: MarR family transcriptional regulator [Opitutaceae bacterium]|nr:MarR family transcriptional regulator [Opitutaceae bacterium]